MTFSKTALLAVLPAALATACVSTTPIATSSLPTVSELAAGAVSGTINGGSSGGSAATANTAMDLSTQPAASCPTPQAGIAGTNCSVDSTGMIMTLTYNSCDFGNRSAVWNGSVILASNAPVSCGTFPSQAAGAALARTFGPGTTRTIGESVHVALLDTSTPSGYAEPVSGGTLTTYSTGSRQIDIKGIHVQETKEFRGSHTETEIQWDHTISTPATSPLTVAVDSSGTRVVNGTVTVQHNLAKYTGAVTFSNVTYVAAAGCCFPQSGTITTVLSGSRTGTETLQFTGASCGDADLDDNGEHYPEGDHHRESRVLGECF
ncbi:MAG: hypothetical protein ACXWP5_16340 [Bdellovibrionota bacterium]